MNNIWNGLRPVWLACVILAWLPGANLASADSIVDTSGLGVSDTIGDLPAPDLDGWFFSPDTELTFPTEPNPSQPWTSAANIATLDYWLSLVMEPGTKIHHCFHNSTDWE